MTRPPAALMCGGRATPFHPTTAATAYVDPLGTYIGLALVEHSHAAPGTGVEVVWGNHPGPGTAPDADLGFLRLRATVQPSPYDEYARTQYRRD